MGFCPKCRVEYLPEIGICLDCGSQLIDKQPNILYKEWVALPCVPSVVHAQAIKRVLEETNIPCYVQSLWYSDELREISSTSLKSATAKVVVNRLDYDRALEIQESMIK